MSHTVRSELKTQHNPTHFRVSGTQTEGPLYATGPRIRCNSRRGMGQLLAALVVLWIVLTGCCTPRPVPPSDDFMSADDERLLWHQSEQEQAALDGSGLVWKQAEIEAYLNRVAARLRPPGTPADLSFRVEIISNPYLNAFAFPNGVIYLHSGLLARMDNEDQLAALLGHEMAHCIGRHALRMYRVFHDQSKPDADGQTTLAGIGALKDMLRFLGAAGTMLAANSYTRELEREADREGLRMAIMAGYDPQQALNLFDHLEEEIQKEGIQEPLMFGDHPNVEQRVAELKSVMNSQEPISASIESSPKLFLAKVQPLILRNARLDLNLGRFQTALWGVQKSLAVRSDDARAHYLMGEIFRQRGQSTDFSTAIACYQQAIKIDPSYAPPYKAIGLLSYKSGQKQLAKQFFQTCLRLDPDISDRAYIQSYLDAL
jgi:predicted Zn-dependent protease